MTTMFNKLYQNINNLFNPKLDKDDYESCNKALTDCYHLLTVWGDDINKQHEIKIYAEIAALRARQLEILADLISKENHGN